MLGSPVEAAALELSEDGFRSLFETAPCAWLVVTRDREILVVNASAERLFGRSRDELVGMSVSDLIPAEAGAWLRAAPPEERAGCTEADPRRDLRARHRDGTEFPVDVSVTELATARGTLLSVAVTDATERRVAAQTLAHRASHDPLTGLPNRTLFLDRVEHALARARRSGRCLAVMFLDLDDFKLVNDTRGHETGDRLLVGLTPRLTAALRPGDTIARFGGDEFVVLCEDLADGADAVRIARRIAQACTGPVTIGDYEHVTTVSAGVALVTDPHTATPSRVLRDADAAMYRAKAAGKGRIEVFDEGMRAQLIQRLAIESSLRRAIDQGELRLYYQPVVSLEDRQIVSAEALLRWQHPRRGLLEPAGFMSVAESTGLILPIGQWVIEEACKQAAAWRRATPDADPVRVSVNLSARQLRPDLPATVGRILDETGLDHDLLELEITETTLLGDADACACTLRKLKALGVRLVLDDFGTGVSSLHAIKRLTIEALKIDRSFIAGVADDGEDAAIVSAMLSMASALDINATAEGVESREQLAHLRAQGCEQAQGYLFSRPVPARELGPVLARSAALEPLAAA
jgi:diguanylate cyclase (GGDEF)-like protein/PAS domain S-box-containing protein